ncbi:hypothetical protein FKW77_009470 [Venturia effusa]|uniref:Uncharacterized protein n=1 Tax=Venturia effusa TaxID=50376 RepID=A0A517LCZ3_9PEZI|nr:hypothetical protein FKW77_009470 [Venturia effusa]
MSEPTRAHNRINRNSTNLKISILDESNTNMDGGIKRGKSNQGPRAPKQTTRVAKSQESSQRCSNAIDNERKRVTAAPANLHQALDITEKLKHESHAIRNPQTLLPRQVGRSVCRCSHCRIPPIDGEYVMEEYGRQKADSKRSAGQTSQQEELAVDEEREDGEFPECRYCDDNGEFFGGPKCRNCSRATPFAWSGAIVSFLKAMIYV